MRRTTIMNEIHTTLTLSFFLFIAFPYSHSQSPPPPPPCAPQSYMCSINVSATAILDPFWEQSPASQCKGAHPSSQLICYDPYKYDRYEHQNLTVKDIDHTTHTMTLVPTDTVKDVCSPEFLKNYENLNSTLLQYYASVHNVTVFFHGCPLDIPKFPSKRKWTCGEDGVYYFEEAYKEDEMLEKYPLLKQCKRSLRLPSAAPLNHYDDSDDGAGVLQQALNDGFEVYYDVPQHCTRCNESNCGMDGYDGHVVSCEYYCPDQHCSPKRSILENRKKLIILAIAGVLILISILCARYKSSTWLASFGLTSKCNQNIEAFLKIDGSLALKRYKLSHLKQMTKNFKEKLGQGGFGTVYKGKLFNGSPIAVKMLSASKENGEEFINEVASISRTSHVNVVSLLGFCLEGRNRALIYEFMSNGSLDKFIYRKSCEVVPPLSWDIIYQIARDIAQGLEYLHKGCNTRIIHFDIKPHNILLDENFYAKISDFGLAKLCPRNESIVSLSDARGTMGYVAPEMWSRNLGRASHKSDVYSYGMMLLEMVGGRKNINAEASRTSEIYFPHWAYNKLELDNDLVPNMVMTTEENKIAKRLAIVGLWCTQTFPNDRPTMSNVINMLEDTVDSLQIPPKPLLSSPTRSVPKYSIS
ncbi:LEAF RUST 10 DISEASE-RESISTANCEUS RECEPTOR-LIKE PROTEIN KINASE-like 2.5 isoform X2 [Phaseolus vulgaris]|uniref:LEAF RUST 10 DISEASE-RESISTANCEUS RECEPTOR-LIKE PROTEIN KINASE-like 2.5 isoform X2 n=1 Tax=Phaseolus vulgaris TaxID=3885 RepID=UPI0035C9493C